MFENEMLIFFLFLSPAAIFANQVVTLVNGLCPRGQGTKLRAMDVPHRTKSNTGQRSKRFPWNRKPLDLEELSARAEALAGLTLGELAADGEIAVPADLRRAKGWVGTLIERVLGASAASRAEPDFPDLGVELKTLPVDVGGKPLESTFVCTIELSRLGDSEWEESRLLTKLRRVLWVPVEGVRTISVEARRIGTPLLWSPTQEEEKQLRADWEALGLMIAQGRTGEITGHLGEVLQVRPKAARGSSRRRTHDEEGALYDEQPKGFYLRTRFTGAILQRHFAL